jgi:hypothetical protein
MPLAVALLIVVALIVTLWIAIGRDEGPSAADVAVSYAKARARGDWSVVYDLSATELRAGRDRAHFVAASTDGDNADGDHDAAIETRTSDDVHIEHATVATDAAIVVVHLDGPAVTLRLECERRTGRWVVTCAELAGRE